MYARIFKSLPTHLIVYFVTYNAISALRFRLTLLVVHAGYVHRLYVATSEGIYSLCYIQLRLWSVCNLWISGSSHRWDGIFSAFKSFGTFYHLTALATNSRLFPSCYFTTRNYHSLHTSFPTPTQTHTSLVFPSTMTSL